MNFFETPVSLLILILILIFSIVGFKRTNSILLRFSLNPYSVVHYRKYYQIFTHIFLHFDFIHLAFNAMTFYFFAPELETTIGSGLFLLLFLTSGIVSSLPSVFKNKNEPNYYSLGASGAIAGIIFSFILFYPTSRIYIFLIPIGIPSPIFAVIYLAYCIYASKDKSSKINHEAHFWGAVWGLVLTIILFPSVIPFFLQSFKNIF
ncbi:MAG: rhomboid family intramembrane serine protease [Ignavibacteria bacterium]|nr:rhomboid family intramembrane serine protease [Ignavibacteria bacterium]